MVTVKIGKHCEECGVFVPPAKLSGGVCYICQKKLEGAASKAMISANNRSLANASRMLLDSLTAQKRGDPMLPEIAESAIAKLGGRHRVGEILAEELLRSRGDPSVMTPELQAKWKYSPAIVHKWAALLMDVANKTDERDSIDVDSLSHDDLIDGLRGLAADLVRDNAEFRRLMVELAIKEQPDLIDFAMNLAGKPVIEVDVAKPVPVPPVVEDKLDYSEAGDAEGYED